MGLGPVCKICGEELDSVSMNKFTFISGIGHLCEICIKKFKMQMGYGGGGTGVLSQEQVNKLVEQRLDKTSDCSNKQIGEDCLVEAQKIINGNRQNDYGTPEDSFQRIADYWNSYLIHNGIMENDSPLFAKDVAMMMVLFKIAREEHAHKHDNLVDICGYTVILDNMYKD